MGIMISPNNSTLSNQQPINYVFALVSLTVLFFMWGFLTSLNDILIPYFKSEFDLNYTQAMLVQFCFFSAYFLVSLPAGKLVNKLGYQKGIVIGLGIAAFGCFCFLIASNFISYGLFLTSLFILASGITVLQVAANPYVTALGTEETASGRLTMTQAFNSLGTTVAPLIGAALILNLAEPAVANSEPQLDAVQLPYLVIALLLSLMAFVFFKLDLPIIESHASTPSSETKPLLKETNLLMGVAAIFLYVGAEVSIGSFLVNFISSPEISNMPESQVAHLIAYFWGGAMLGRFLGAIAMQLIKPQLYLGVNATLAMCFIVIAMTQKGDVAMYAILAVGLFNGVMFPTIFSLALQGMKERTGQASGLLCQAIVGGALVPLIQGFVADSVGIQISFVVPLICYLFICFYGFKASRSRIEQITNQ